MAGVKTASSSPKAMRLFKSGGLTPGHWRLERRILSSEPGGPTALLVFEELEFAYFMHVVVISTRAALPLFIDNNRNITEGYFLLLEKHS